MPVGEDSMQYKKRKEHLFLAAANLLFIGKNHYNLLASLSRLEALFLDLASHALNNYCSFWNKESDI